jgi:hypothetical protein
MCKQKQNDSCQVHYLHACFGFYMWRTITSESKSKKVFSLAFVQVLSFEIHDVMSLCGVRAEIRNSKRTVESEIE